ncbi:hypothetical protein HBB16_15520 [Pseudonocardia sp. MCCB 268]|nr:hypothetical protein [Pseudonocardia cytotoxica]
MSAPDACLWSRPGWTPACPGIGHPVARMGGDEFGRAAVDPRVTVSWTSWLGPCLRCSPNRIDVDGHRLRTLGEHRCRRVPSSPDEPGRRCSSPPTSPLTGPRSTAANRWACFDLERTAGYTVTRCRPRCCPAWRTTSSSSSTSRSLGLVDVWPRGIEASCGGSTDVRAAVAGPVHRSLAEESGAIVPLQAGARRGVRAGRVLEPAEHPGRRAFRLSASTCQAVGPGGRLLCRGRRPHPRPHRPPPRRLQLELTESALLGPPAGRSPRFGAGRARRADRGRRLRHRIPPPELPGPQLPRTHSSRPGAREGIRTPHPRGVHRGQHGGAGSTRSMAVTAEGVETCAQRARLRVGCDTAQGWLPGAPCRGPRSWPSCPGEVSQGSGNISQSLQAAAGGPLRPSGR